MEAQITISMQKGETILCPGCGKVHQIKLEDICLSLGTCEICESEIIVENDTMEVGAIQ